MTTLSDQSPNSFCCANAHTQFKNTKNELVGEEWQNIEDVYLVMGSGADELRDLRNCSCLCHIHNGTHICGEAMLLAMAEDFASREELDEDEDDEDDDSACPLCGEDGGTRCGMPNCQY